MKMKRYLLPALACIGMAVPASAQYGDIINGITNTILPAIQHGSGYKGFVEADYTQGFGNYRCNFATLSTSQGYMLNNWFYMGAGIGVHLLWSTVNSGGVMIGRRAVRTGMNTKRQARR